MIIKNANIVLEDKIIKNGSIEIENGLIKNISETTIGGDEVIDAKGQFVLPGFIDIHGHGGYGIDHNTFEIEKFNEYRKKVGREGVTSYLHSTVTMSDEQITKSFPVFAEFMKSQKQDGATCYGMYMEGPFISKERKGAHEEAMLQKPDPKVFDKYNKLSGNNVKIVVYAPENSVGNFTEHLVKQGVIPSVGHTTVNAEQFQEFADKGSNNITHLFNAMSGVDHYNPGLVVGAINDNRVMCELITDGIHVHPKTLKMAYKAIGPDRIIIITDSMNAKGLPDGNYFLGPLAVVKKGMKITLAEGNTLAAAGSTYDNNVRTMAAAAGITNDLSTLIKMTSINSAKHLGIYDVTGSITIGKKADLVFVNDKIEVLKTIANGRIEFTK
ncbi:N-acetylglucosamine-6-phosphate deacetylase [Spiroplasma endosymbiont of Othius punctulatus]|uniref:N-acetylglucosamine-6-phosphate deacetylase n=1 Tax=Spiroplasma endosymbiont of Othius punctulatus TaxID=3066289 RepID=UPI0030CC7CE1